MLEQISKNTWRNTGSNRRPQATSLGLITTWLFNISRLNITRCFNIHVFNVQNLNSYTRDSDSQGDLSRPYPDPDRRRRLLGLGGSERRHLGNGPRGWGVGTRGSFGSSGSSGLAGGMASGRPAGGRALSRGGRSSAERQPAGPQESRWQGARGSRVHVCSSQQQR